MLHVFADPTTYGVTYAFDMKLLTQQYGFFLVFDEEQPHSRDRAWAAHALFPEGRKSLEYHAQAYRQITLDLIKDYTYSIQNIPGKRVDIVGNVINLVAVRWVADYVVRAPSFLFFIGLLMDSLQMGVPLKTAKNPKGLFTEQELYDMLSLLFTCALINVQPEHSWQPEHGALPIAQVLQKIIARNAEGLSATVSPSFLRRLVS